MPDALVIAPPARLIGLLPKNSAGLTQFSPEFLNQWHLIPQNSIANPAPGSKTSNECTARPACSADLSGKSTHTSRPAVPPAAVILGAKTVPATASRLLLTSAPCRRSPRPLTPGRRSGPRSASSLPLPLLMAAMIWSTVSFWMSGSEAALMPIILAIPALGVPVAPWQVAHLAL